MSCDTVAFFAQDIFCFCFFDILIFKLFLLWCCIHLKCLLIFLHSYPGVVVARLFILFLVNLFVKKNVADVNLSSGVPMVVALDKNMYKSPRQ
jgi:hypothetical protein